MTLLHTITDHEAALLSGAAAPTDNPARAYTLIDGSLTNYGLAKKAGVPSIVNPAGTFSGGNYGQSKKP